MTLFELWFSQGICTVVGLLGHMVVSLAFLLITILTGMKSYLIVVLICISLMIGDVCHLYMHLLALCMSLEKCLFSSSSYF